MEITTVTSIYGKIERPSALSVIPPEASGQAVPTASDVIISPPIESLDTRRG
ncbi:MAG: hypothetical protein JW878_07050 [Methanomicrobia archaeon]|nr:hypothetical protein [Methanomicrobia archaeon]